MDGALLLLVPTRSYRTEDFLAAASRLSVAVVLGSDLCHRVEEQFGPADGQVSLDYRRPEAAAERIAELARERSLRGIVPTDGGTAVIAALAAARLGLPSNPPEATRRAANKHRQRVTLSGAGLPVPEFAL